MIDEDAAAVAALSQAVLPSPLRVQDGAAPPEPNDYGEGFVLPEHSEKPLQKLNRHPLDARLAFYAGPHIYTFDGVPTSDSVTSQAHRFEEPFDGPAAIRNMKSNPREAWPRKAYAMGVQTFGGCGPLPVGRGALAVLRGKTVSVCQPHSLDEGADVLAFLATAVVKGVEWDEGEAEVYTFERAMHDEEILNSWRRKGLVACNQGTDAHYLAELFFNGLPTRCGPEMAILCDFVRREMVPRGLLAHNTEKEIVCKDADLAGSIDLIVFDPRNELYHIVDHKRSDKLAAQLRGYRKMLAPFSHLDDCKGAGYALQTSIYQYILERDYGMAIGDRVLLSLHPGAPFATSVPYLKAEVEHLMQLRFDLVAARRAAARDDPECAACRLTGAPLVDAVRLCGNAGHAAEGELVMRRAAVVRALAYVGDDAARDAFEARVAAALPLRPEIKRCDCIPWRKLVPEAGLPPFAGW